MPINSAMSVASAFMNRTNTAGNSNMATTIDLCKISSINSDLSADVEFLDGSKFLSGVAIAFPVASNAVQEISMPIVGTIALVAVTGKGKPFIIGYPMYGAMQRTEMTDGEIYKRSAGGAYLKLDSDGNIITGTEGFATQILTASGDSASLSVTNRAQTSTKEEVSGTMENSDGSLSAVNKRIIYATPGVSDYNDQKYEDGLSHVDPSNDGTVLNNFSRHPAVVIEEGIAVGEDGNPVRLEILNNPDLDKELAYRITVNNIVDGTQTFQLLIDRDGNVRMKSKKLIIDAESLDMSACNEILYP